jgi:Domain of unknown function (DUF932)
MLNIEGMPLTVNQNSAHNSRSEKYSHLPTKELIGTFERYGFTPSKVVETRVRKTDRVGFQKHMIRFRHASNDTVVGDSIPEIVVINSHDGTSGLQFWAGLFRLVCENGMVVASATFGKYSIPHRGDIMHKAIFAANAVSIDAQRAGKLSIDWGKIILPREKQLEFAHRALELRYPEQGTAPVLPHDVLLDRRPDDVGNDLWRVFNKVQENVTRGGLSGYAQHVRRSVRPVRGVTQNVALNAKLWSLADEYAMAA